MPYNPGNIRKLNALGGKRPQATGIAILPKNRGNVLATSEGSVANYGGNKKMGLYSNVGMSYNFQNLNLTGTRLNGNLPYFWGTNNANTKASQKTKNMITMDMVNIGTGADNNGHIGFISRPYFKEVGSSLPTALQDYHGGTVNQKGTLNLSNTKIIAMEMWRSGSDGPVDYGVQPGIHIWATNKLRFGSVTIKQGSKQVKLNPVAVYTKDSLPTTSTGAEGNKNDKVKDSLTADANGKYFYPEGTTNPAEIPETTHVYWLPFPDTTKVIKRKNDAGVLVDVTVPNKPGVDARLIFPNKSRVDTTAATTKAEDLSSLVAVYFE